MLHRTILPTSTDPDLSRLEWEWHSHYGSMKFKPIQHPGHTYFGDYGLKLLVFSRSFFTSFHSSESLPSHARQGYLVVVRQERLDSIKRNRTEHPAPRYEWPALYFEYLPAKEVTHIDSDIIASFLEYCETNELWEKLKLDLANCGPLTGRYVKVEWKYQSTAETDH